MREPDGEHHCHSSAGRGLQPRPQQLCGAENISDGETPSGPVRIRKSDGSVAVQHFTLEDGAVMLEPDVREYFPDSESVNNALRSLIMLIPQKQKVAAHWADRMTGTHL